LWNIGAYLDMAHETPRAYQQACGIRQNATKEEPDVHVGPERIDVAKGEVANAGCGVAIMEQFQDVRTA